MAWGDCDTCLHDGDMSYCDECAHFERDTYDHYEEASPEVVAKREEEARQAAIKNAISEWVECEIPDEFRQMFEKAQKCASPEHYRKALMCVHAADDGYLISSDSHMLLEMPCGIIPEPLKGRNILKLEAGRAAINNNPYPNYKAIFAGLVSSVTTSYEEVIQEEYNGNDKEAHLRYGRKPIWLCNNDKRILIDGVFLETMQELLTGQIAVSYSETNLHAPLLFVGDNGRILIVPMRT